MSSVFDKHRRIMDEYKSYVSSFFRIEDERIKSAVEASVLGGQYWPEPLIQFNPSFELGESIQELVKQGVDNYRVSMIISPAARMNILHRLLLLNHKTHAEEVARNGGKTVWVSGEDDADDVLVGGEEAALKPKAALAKKAVKAGQEELGL